MSLKTANVCVNPHKLIAVQVPGACCQNNAASHWPLQPHHVPGGLDVTGRAESVQLLGRNTARVWTESSRDSQAPATCCLAAVVSVTLYCQHRCREVMDY